jgi:hypothetical protein
MNRIKDYSGFAAWFLGLGYLVLWPITADEFGGVSFGASILCREGAAQWLGLLCNAASALRLPPGLHLLGFMSALYVAARVLADTVRRSRHASLSATSPALHADAPPPRKPRPPRRYVKPRTQFGLRGLQR